MKRDTVVKDGPVVTTRANCAHCGSSLLAYRPDDAVEGSPWFVRECLLCSVKHSAMRTLDSASFMIVTPQYGRMMLVYVLLTLIIGALLGATTALIYISGTL